MTGSPLEVVAVFAAAGAILAAVIHADNWWLAHHRPGPAEPPSRLDQLDGLDSPARSSAPSPLGKSERAGAYPDEWSI